MALGRRARDAPFMQRSRSLRRLASLSTTCLVAGLWAACSEPSPPLVDAGGDAGVVAPVADAGERDAARGDDGGSEVPSDAGSSAGPILGTVADGEEIRIRGRDFPEREHARPLLWADFEEGTEPTALGRLTEWASFNGERTDAERAPGSAHAIRLDHAASSDAAGGSVSFEGDRLYIFIKRFYDTDITDPGSWGSRGFNHKTIRLWNRCGSECEYRQNNIYFGYQGSEGGNPRVVAEYTGERTVWDGPAPTAGEWTQEEWLYRAGDVDAMNGTFDHVRGGVPQWEGRFRMRTSEYPGRYDRVFFDQVSNGTGPGPIYTYHDDLYVDTTWTRVMITDGPTLAGSRVREIQIPLEWSATEIRVLVRQGAHDTLDGRYLLVIGEDGSEQSFPL